ncbi:hypothetical protein D3C81_1964040 [compost metagenome]
MVIFSLALISRLPTSRIRMTLSAVIDMVWISTEAAAGELADTSVSVLLPLFSSVR